MQGKSNAGAPMAGVTDEDAEENVDHAGFTKWLSHVAKEILSRNQPLSKEVREDRRAHGAHRVTSSEGRPMNYIDVLSHLSDRLLDEENSSGFERVAASLRALFRRSVSSDLELVFQHAPQILQFFLPQLLMMATSAPATQDRMALRFFILQLCRRSVYLSLLCVWFLQAQTQDETDQPVTGGSGGSAASRRRRAARAVLPPPERRWPWRLLPLSSAQRRAHVAMQEALAQVHPSVVLLFLSCSQYFYSLSFAAYLLI
jgi:hypothetical protein